MPAFSLPEIIAGFIFGSIGFVAFVYGKRMNVWTPMFLGLALMVYPYFASAPVALWGIGTALTAALFVFRR